MLITNLSPTILTLLIPPNNMKNLLKMASAAVLSLTFLAAHAQQGDGKMMKKDEKADGKMMKKSGKMMSHDKSMKKSGKMMKHDAKMDAKMETKDKM